VIDCKLSILLIYYLHSGIILVIHESRLSNNMNIYTKDEQVFILRQMISNAQAPLSTLDLRRTVLQSTLEELRRAELHLPKKLYLGLH